jgi:hypothetical protein
MKSKLHMNGIQLGLYLWNSLWNKWNIKSFAHHFYSVLEFEVQSSLVFQGIFKLLGIWNPKDFSLLKLVLSFWVNEGLKLVHL